MNRNAALHRRNAHTRDSRVHLLLHRHQQQPVPPQTRPDGPSRASETTNRTPYANSVLFYYTSNPRQTARHVYTQVSPRSIKKTDHFHPTLALVGCCVLAGDHAFLAYRFVHQKPIHPHPVLHSVLLSNNPPTRPKSFQHSHRSLTTKA